MMKLCYRSDELDVTKMSHRSGELDVTKMRTHENSGV